MSQKNKTQERADARTESIFYTCQWLIVAFALTLTFIVFEMQAYTIPTGSMADTLKGAHFRLCCSQCGYKYDYDFIPQFYKLERNVKPGNNIPIFPVRPRCPSCGYYHPVGRQLPDGKLYISPDRFEPVLSGDRIFVLKCLYQFIEPARWDVIVFKNPLNPHENYIKRLIALPNETLELIDGDVYIDGTIQRKPVNVQKELWMVIYDNDYQPVKPDVRRFNGHEWSQPFKNTEGSAWNLNAADSTVFGLNVPVDEVHTIVYDTDAGNDFKATYAYDDPRRYALMPICSDLAVQFYVNPQQSGIIGASLSKYRVEYRGWVDFAGTGRLVIEKIDTNGNRQELVTRQCRMTIDGPIRFRFTNVDHLLTVEAGAERIEYDLGTGSGDAGQRAAIMPRAAIFGSGTIELSHVGIFRDIHYITSDGQREILRAGPDNPFKLNDDEFFVCGDNSPASLDSRWWPEAGLGNNSETYRRSVVPRDYLVGRAMFVYWPGPYKPFNDTKLAKFLEKSGAMKFLKLAFNIPHVSGIKMIHGG